MILDTANYWWPVVVYGLLIVCLLRLARTCPDPGLSGETPADGGER